MIMCADHHCNIDLCGCDADEQYRRAQSSGAHAMGEGRHAEAQRVGYQTLGIVNQLRENAGWRNQAFACQTSPQLLTDAADLIERLTSAVPETPRHAEGWLVERENNDGLMYAMATRWDRDYAKAIRFSRREDAAAFAECHAADFTRIAQHRWG